MRFLFVHGGFHGAWCWELVSPAIRRLGHEALAIDLPGHGKRRDERSLLTDRRDALVAVMQTGDVLVGHSGGGFDITLAADAVPEKVGHLVYLAAGLPLEGRPLVDATGGATGGSREVNGEIDRLSRAMPNEALRPTANGRLEWVDKELARKVFYHDCPPELVDWAFSQLSPAPPEILVEPVKLSRFWSADLPRSYILCREDRALPVADARTFISRLGVQPLAIDGSHSPFLSRPAELATLLLQAVQTKPTGPLRPG